MTLVRFDAPGIAHGQDIHFVVQLGRGPSPLPLVLTHGWPGSLIEFENVIPLLTDPSAHGGAPDHDEIFNRVMSDKRLRTAAHDHLAREVYERIRRGDH